jgi:DNA helicase-2/ATP-dependent DNA helicase PcrA
VSWLTDTTRADQPDESGDAIEVATFHAAKGLEWRTVHLAGLERGFAPISHAKTPDALEEERRLIYVAITRAQRELLCTWAEQRTFGSRSMSRSPSPYLEDIERAADRLRGQGATNWREEITKQRASLGAGGRAQPSRPERSRGGARRARADRPPVPEADGAVVDALKAWRSSVARAAGIPAYVIFHDRTLHEIAARRPRCIDELLDVPGIGQVKADRYGSALLQVLQQQTAS